MKRLTYANVMSTIAVFLALSTGTAFAAKTLIDGKQIKRNTITSAHIKNKSITAADVKNGSLPASVLSRQAVNQIAERVESISAPPAAEDGYPFGTQNPKVVNGVFSSNVVPTGEGTPCVVLAGREKTSGTWAKTSGGLSVCNIGDGKDHAPAVRGGLNGGVNAY